MAAKHAKRHRSFLNRVVTIVCIAVLIFGAAYLGNDLLQTLNTRANNQETSRLYHQAQAEAKLEAESPLPTKAPRSTPKSTEKPFTLNDMPVVEDVLLVLQPEFVELKEKNEDTIGWITCGGNVDYPLLWYDNELYMDHDFDKKENNAGAIFLDMRNEPYLEDTSMLIYGHNMRSGAMFGDLDMFRKLKYVQENPIITLQSAWEEEPRKFVIFALFDASMNPDDPTYIKITEFEFETDEEKEEHVKAIEERTIFELPVEVEPEDQIVGLVTCSYSQDNGRFLIYARSLHEDETEEDILELFAEIENE